jgi:hypothetical protein
MIKLPLIPLNLLTWKRTIASHRRIEHPGEESAGHEQAFVQAGKTFSPWKTPSRRSPNIQFTAIRKMRWTSVNLGRTQETEFYARQVLFILEGASSNLQKFTLTLTDPPNGSFRVIFYWKTAKKRALSRLVA